MIYFRWAIVVLNVAAALTVAARLQSNERNRGTNGFLLGLNVMAATWQTTSILES